MTMVKLLLNRNNTASKPYQIVLDADGKTITANGRYIFRNRICSG
jgi:hypothetical protein